MIQEGIGPYGGHIDHGGLMALAHAILTAVAHEPLSGYDLTRAFKTSTGYFWRATRQQIYRELTRLDEKSLITGTVHPQEKLPDKTLWSITPSGVKILKDWINKPSNPASIKEEILVKLYALDYANLGEFINQLKERRDYHRERLVLFENIEQKISSTDKIDIGELGKLLGVKSGINYEKAMLEWCECSIDQIKKYM